MKSKDEVLDSKGAGGRNRTDTRLPSRDFEYSVHNIQQLLHSSQNIDLIDT
jgi:hypothetical protein